MTRAGSAATLALAAWALAAPAARARAAADALHPLAGTRMLWATPADTTDVPTPTTWARNPVRPRRNQTREVQWERDLPTMQNPSLAATWATLAEGEGRHAEAARSWLGARSSLAALNRAGAEFLAAGDTVRADSCWAALAARSPIWRWDALRARAELALAGGRPGLGDSLLAADRREGWPDAWRAGWLGLRARLRAAAVDTAGALDFCRQMLQRYVSLPAAGDAVSLIAAIQAARGDSLDAESERGAAEADFWRGDRRNAAERLARVVRLTAGEERRRAGLRRAEVLRADQRFTESLAAWREACADSADGAGQGRCLLERARIDRDAGRSAAALDGYARAATADSSVRQAAMLEAAAEAEQHGHWIAARRDYQAAYAAGGRRAEGAALRVGLLFLAEGRRREAETWLRRSSDEAARFWLGVTLRRRHRRAADSLLRAVAGAPGYSFYSTAARETLGLRGIPDRIPHEVGAFPYSTEPPISREALETGRGDLEAATVDRWIALGMRRTEAGPLPDSARPEALLRCAHFYHSVGLTAAALRASTRAFDLLPDSAETRWSAALWNYPPAYAPLIAKRARESGERRLDAAVLAALIWQESRFDSRARSRSEALGLMQMKHGTAVDAARWSGRPAPPDSQLFDPLVNTRLGTAYLARQLRRYQGHLPSALAAYNAGPGRIPVAWIARAARGGVALYCELLPFPETRDYVKRILATRAAYRELRPVVADRTPE